MKIHLGVIDVPYSNGTQTTGDVAEILEGKYKIMERFVTLHNQQFADDLARSAAGFLTNLMAGGPRNADPFAQAIEDMKTQWKLFLDHEDIVNTSGPGVVPTEAALKGVSHRFKGKKVKRRRFEDSSGTVHQGPRRPSFIDTGMYQSTFTAWTEK